MLAVNSIIYMQKDSIFFLSRLMSCELNANFIFENNTYTHKEKYKLHYQSKFWFAPTHHLIVFFTVKSLKYEIPLMGLCRDQKYLTNQLFIYISNSSNPLPILQLCTLLAFKCLNFLLVVYI